jgi:hypothetical protein
LQRLAAMMRTACVLCTLIACGANERLPAPGSDPDAADSKADDTSAPPDAPAPGIWQPTPGASWQWQLTGTIDTSLAVAMYDIDLFDAPDPAIAALSDRIVICYFSAGSREDWRTDANQFPPATIGAPLDGWPGERWIDVRAPEVRSIMRARLDLAVARGCDGVEPDNIDGYANGNGLGLTAADQLDYNKFLAAEAHARGLSIGLKNDLDQVPQLLSHFDWALNEECFAYDECDTLAPFIAANKAVFQVEYGGQATANAVCADAVARQFSTLIKNLDLDAARIACE